MYKIIPPVQRFFTYVFIIIGIIWFGSANYYYFAEECLKFKGALITGSIFFVLAFISSIWEYYKQNNRAKQNNLNELFIKAFPVLLPLFYKVTKRAILNARAAKIFAFGIIILLAVLFIIDNKNDKT